MSWHKSMPIAIICFYLISIALEWALARRALVKARYVARDTLAAFGMAMGNFATNLLMAGIVFAGLSLAYRWRLFSIAPSSPLTWVVIFFLDDFTYYWFHRLSHECRLWWAAHVNHHSSQQYNLSTALRQTWTGELAGTWMPWIPLALLGFPPEMILLQQTFNLTYQFWIHTEAIGRMPRWFEYVFNSPSHHRVHHASNPRYLDRNYAGVLMLWDRLFGTFAEETAQEPVRYGLVKNIESYNPIKIAFHEWLAIAHDLCTARSLREAAFFLFGPPGWRADGTGATSGMIRADWQAKTAARPQQS